MPQVLMMDVQQQDEGTDGTWNHWGPKCACASDVIEVYNAGRKLGQYEKKQYAS